MRSIKAILRHQGGTRLLRRACEATTLSFPRDHGQHSDFRTEWWYLSGHLYSDTGIEWAYHFTIFRRALEKWTDLALVAAAISSRAVRNIAAFQRALARMLESQNSKRIGVDGYVSHLAITNLAQQEYAFFERAGTSLFQIAGARGDCLNAWVKGWKFQDKGGLIHVAAERDKFGIDLELHPVKPPVLHGSQGLTNKGSETGQASYHYSLAPLSTSGSLMWRGETIHVQGDSWMDREFATSMMPKSVRGWDWFGLILDNGHEVMISLIRLLDGSIAETSSATLVLPDGTSRGITADHLRVEPAEFWISPATGARYPVNWVAEIDRVNLCLNISALIKEHELVSASSTTVDYWEGPVRVSGTMCGKPIAGNGHVELVGYSQSVGGKF